MTFTYSGDPVDAPDKKSAPTLPVRATISLAALAIVLVGVVCYYLGAGHRSNGPGVLTGRAYVSTSQVGVTVDGRSYGFEITQNGMEWYDASGGSHEGGVPPCLQQPGYAWIRFGYANAAGLNDGSTWRAVTWVQCIDRAG